MGIWQNVRIDVVGNRLSEQDLYAACESLRLKDIFVRPGKDRLVAEAQGSVDKPDQLAKTITDAIQATINAHVIVRIYKQADRIWERNVGSDGSVHLDG